jgi:hypothetical protein
MLLSALDDLFWLTVKYHVDTDTHLVAVQYFGSSRIAKRFQYCFDHPYTVLGKSIFPRPVSTCLEDVKKTLADQIPLFRPSHLDPFKPIPGFKLSVFE